MKRIYSLFLLLILFLGENVLSLINIDWKIITILFIIISSLFCFSKKSILLNRKSYLTLCIFVIIFCLYKFIYIDHNFNKMSLLIITPPIIISCFPIKTKYTQLWNKCFNVYTIFFIVECCIAIFEKITQTLIFARYSYDNDLLMEIFSYSDFRSWSLLGHPLQNALVVSTMMNFFMISTLTFKKKIILFSLGYLAILSFNTRSSIIIEAIFLLIFFIYTAKNKNNITISPSKIYTTLFAIIALFVILIIRYDFGSRIFLGIIDNVGSASTRIDVWNIFNYYSLEDFMYGLTPNQYNRVKITSGITVTENFWIDYLLYMGFIFMILLVINYIWVIKRSYKTYSKFEIFYTLVPFLLIASSNNSLSASWIQLFVFLFSINLFEKQNKTNYVMTTFKNRNK